MEPSACPESLLSTEGTITLSAYNIQRHKAFPDMNGAEDDWTGVTSAATRRKLQNRLNQRAWRRRQKENGHGAAESKPTLIDYPMSWFSLTVAPSDEARQQTDIIAEGLVLKDEGLSLITRENDLRILSRFVKQAYEEYTLRTPRLSSLPLLVRINLLNALAFNASKLQFPSAGLCCADLISSFNLSGPVLPPDSTSSSVDCPNDLRPTSVQRSVIHHPWIDLLPFVAIRDNMLNSMALGHLDDGELCDDILGLHEGALDDSPAMMVWGYPSESASWEVNTAFLQKWGWIVKGCPQIITATNAWRIKRGENPVSFEA